MKLLGRARRYGGNLRRRNIAPSLNAARPAWLSVLLGVGVWVIAWYFNDVGLDALHHGAVVWLVGLVAVGYAVVGLYKEVSNRVKLHRWLALAANDPEEALKQAESIQRFSRMLPPWLLRSFHETRGELRRGGHRNERGPSVETDAIEPTHTRLRPPQVTLLALGALIAVVALAAWLSPERIYYPIVWRYYWGPIVSDYAGGPLVRGGVTADPGYNVMDTTTWALILGVSLWNLLDSLRRRGFRLTRAFTYSLVPMIIAGGTMRGLIEVHWLPAPWAYFFITPLIYVVFFLYTLGALLLGMRWEERGSGGVRHWHLTLAAGILAVLITWGGWGVLLWADPAGIRWSVLWRIFGTSTLLTAGIVAVLWVPRIRFVRDPLYVLVLFGQIVDGMQNYVGTTEGHVSKMLGPHFLVASLGNSGLLIAKVFLIVPLLAYLKAKVEPEEDGNVLQLVLLTILALGLAMGFHGGVGLLLGE
ncbi:MAG: DUF63 family protein [Candidatus Thermoplasmatota archaeon]